MPLPTTGVCHRRWSPCCCEPWLSPSSDCRHGSRMPPCYPPSLLRTLAPWLLALPKPSRCEPPGSSAMGCSSSASSWYSVAPARRDSPVFLGRDMTSEASASGTAPETHQQWQQSSDLQPDRLLRYQCWWAGVLRTSMHSDARRTANVFNLQLKVNPCAFVASGLEQMVQLSFHRHVQSAHDDTSTPSWKLVPNTPTFGPCQAWQP